MKEGSSALTQEHRKLDSYYAQGYLATWCSSVRPDWSAFLHEVFVDLAATANDQQPSVLDLGCGPSISNVISASGWSRHVHMCDLLRSNLDEIQKFRRGDEAAFSWEHYFRHVADLEGRAGDENLAALAERTRRAIRGVHYCDIAQDRLRLRDYPEDEATEEDMRFDLVILSLVLDVVATTEDAFAAALTRVKRDLLRHRRGWLVVQGSLGETTYTVGSASFPVMNIDEPALRDVFERCGFRVARWRLVERETRHYFVLLQSALCD